MSTVRDIISGKFVRIGADHSASEAVSIVFDPRESVLREIVIVVFNSDGGYIGILEPRDLLDCLGTELSVAGENPTAQVAAIRRGLSTRVSEIARRGIPALQLDDHLPKALHLAATCDSSHLPVFDGDTFVGILPLTSLFQKICQLTLSVTGEDLPFQS